jgi:purine/pyrimidine-nucleoside phosphorylase
MSAIPERFAGVTAVAKANVYFEGKVVSHTILFPDGAQKTLGLIYAGTYHFATGKAERMELVAGACKAKLDGQPESRAYTAGQAFEVPANSAFDMTVEQGICEYICSYLD